MKFYVSVRIRTATQAERQSFTSVARFFLHIRDADGLIEDPDGSDLPDIDAAREEAIRSAREVLAEAIRQGKLVIDHSIEIFGEDGRYVATVRFRDAID